MQRSMKLVLQPEPPNVFFFSFLYLSFYNIVYTKRGGRADAAPVRRSRSCDGQKHRAPSAMLACPPRTRAPSSYGIEAFDVVVGANLAAVKVQNPQAAR